MEYFSKLKELFNINETIGFSKDELQPLINKYSNLPKVLVEYYQQLGKHEILNHVQNNLIEPTQLYELNGYLIFYTENQWVAQWGIALEDLKQDNPPVYVTYDDEIFYKETETLTVFLISAGYLNAVLGLEYSIEEFIEINEEQYRQIVSKYNKCLEQLSEWLPVEFYQNHNDDIIYIDRNNHDLIFSSSSKNHFNELNKTISKILDVDTLSPWVEDEEDF